MGLTLEELAWVIHRRSGARISAATLSRLERGLYEPEVTRAVVAKALKTDPLTLWMREAA